MTSSSRKVRNPARTATPLPPDALARERADRGIPAEPLAQRNWIRYQLVQRGWSQARVARATSASESSVSVIYMGERAFGLKSDRVRELTAKIIEVPEAVLFPEAAEEHARKAKAQAIERAQDREFQSHLAALGHKKNGRSK